MAEKKRSTLDTMRDVAPLVVLGGATTLDVAAGLAEAEEYDRWGNYNFEAFSRKADMIRSGAVATDEQYGRLAHKLRGAQISTAAAQGKRITGSVIDVMADAAAQLELERKSKVVAQRNEATAADAQAQERRYTAQSGKRQANIQATGRLIRGFSDLLDSL